MRIQIGPPLGGSRFWLATEGPGNPQSHHWGSLQSTNGVVTVAQRFAIDFVGLNNAGHALPVAPDTPQASQNAEWFGFNADVLRMADGLVVMRATGNRIISPWQLILSQPTLLLAGFTVTLSSWRLHPASLLITPTCDPAACVSAPEIMFIGAM